MNRTEYFDCLERVLAKLETHSDGTFEKPFIIDDVDFDCTYGLDSNDYLIVSGNKTLFHLENLSEIKYSIGSEDEWKNYIYYRFQNGDYLYYYWDRGYYQFCYEGKYYSWEKSTEIIENFPIVWNGEKTIINGKKFIACLNDVAGEILIPDGIEHICRYAFDGTEVEEIRLSNSVKSVGKRAFSAKTLRSIDLAKVERIEELAFAGCSNLRHIVIPETVVELGTPEWSAFRNSGIESTDQIENHSGIDIILDKDK